MHLAMLLDILTPISVLSLNTQQNIHNPLTLSRELMSFLGL